MGNEGSRLTSGKSFRRRNSKSGQNYIAEDEMDRNNNNLQEIPAPKPIKRMDKLRRSLTFRKKKKDKNSPKSQQIPSTQLMLQSQVPTELSYSSNNTTQNSASNTSTQLNNNISSLATTSMPQIYTSQSNHNTTASSISIKQMASNATTNDTTTNAVTATVIPPTGPARPILWIEDEKKVRAGSCSFQVKYLGFQEVSDSRGMNICEMAIEKLIADSKEKKKGTKAILYVSGDSLRVVDESNKALIVDQTIEKVSFCAPDRHHESGFAYICRDGTARRWLCHGFMAIKDTLKNAGATGAGSSGGERLSHAVGCAFSVCLEKKQKRERENVSMEVGPNHSFTRFGSFRQASITERFEDPQMVMPKADPVPIKQVDNPHAIERPKANPEAAFNRQNPLRGSGVLQAPNFKRNSPSYQSLRPGELPSFQQQKAASGFNNDNLTPSQSITKISILTQNNNSNWTNNNMGIMNPNCNINKSDTSNTINTISELPEENIEDSATTLTKTDINNQFQQQQYFQPSVFATPQSQPMTPQQQVLTNNPTIKNSQTPPPLPPMPTKIQTTPMMQYNRQIPVNNNLNSINQLIANGNSSSVMSTPSYTNTSLLGSPLASASTSSTSETFEQKWARIQAAKKTNPFAEDIAKKFEIKL